MQLGKTPLYYAFRETHSKMIGLLLLSRAEPWATGKNNFKAFLMQVDKEARILYRQAKQVIKETPFPISQLS